MNKLQFGILVVFVCLYASAPAQAILARCPDGTVVGPLFPPNICEGHGGSATSYTGGAGDVNQAVGNGTCRMPGGWGVADPIVDAVRNATDKERDCTYEECVAYNSSRGPNPSWGCEGLQHQAYGSGGNGNGSGGGGGGGSQTNPGPKDAVVPVTFKFPSLEDCLGDLSIRASEIRGDVILPDSFRTSDGLERFCHSNSSGSSVALKMKFKFPNGPVCVHTLKTLIPSIHGDPDLANGSEEAFCQSLFGSSGGSGNGNSNGGGGGGASSGVETSDLGDKNDNSVDFGYSGPMEGHSCSAGQSQTVGCCSGPVNIPNCQTGNFSCVSGKWKRVGEPTNGVCR